MLATPGCARGRRSFRPGAEDAEALDSLAWLVHADLNERAAVLALIANPMVSAATRPEQDFRRRWLRLEFGSIPRDTGELVHRGAPARRFKSRGRFGRLYVGTY
jgi:hypothetical protein